MSTFGDSYWIKKFEKGGAIRQMKFWEQMLFLSCRIFFVYLFALKKASIDFKGGLPPRTKKNLKQGEKNIFFKNHGVRLTVFQIKKTFLWSFFLFNKFLLQKFFISELSIRSKLVKGVPSSFRFFWEPANLFWRLWKICFWFMVQAFVITFHF